MARGESLDGVLVLDKPGGMTSRLALNIVFARLKTRTPLGHAGTLDPMATGVLVACLGRTTRLIECIQELPKTYAAEIRFGFTSTTDDADGELSPAAEVETPSETAFRALLDRFTGSILQRPPRFSAVKIAGRRAHKIARSGVEPDLAPRPVHIRAIEVESFEWPMARIKVHCGKGTYIRSLARDVGEALGTGGYIAALRRLAVGPYTVEGAIGRDNWEQDKLRAALQGRESAVAALPRIELPVAVADSLCHGRPQQAQPDWPARVDHAVFDSTGRMRAVAHVSDGMLRPTKVFHAPDSVSQRPIVTG